MGVLAGLGECPMAFGDNTDHRCAWCGDGLPGRRRRWCSDEHGRAWSRNHAWTDARQAARERDGHRCVRCGKAEGERALVGTRQWEAFIHWAWALHDWGAPPNHLRHWGRAVRWSKAIDPGLRRRWEAAGRGTRIEVNHIVPRRGGGYGNGCWHHLDNLEAVCVECHRAVTAAQKIGWEGSARDLPLETHQLTLPAA